MRVLCGDYAHQNISPCTRKAEHFGIHAGSLFYKSGKLHVSDWGGYSYWFSDPPEELCVRGLLRGADV